MSRPLTAAIEVSDSVYTAWLAPEGVVTDDARLILADSISWREGRLPLTWSDSEMAHEDAVHVGVLTDLRFMDRDGARWAVATVEWDSDEQAQEARRLVDEDQARGVSIHASADGGILCADQIDPATLIVDDAKALVDRGVDFEGCGEMIEVAWGLKILGATLVLIPAFEDAEVVVASVSGAADLPLADRGRAWDAARAQASMFGPDDDDPDFATARRGHFFVRESGERKGDYVLPFAEKTDGSLKAVPRGIFASAGGRGVDRVAGLSSADRDAIKRKICAYYSRIREEGEDLPCPFEASLQADLFRPPVGWFDDPELACESPLTVTASGQVFGHLATWDTCHRGFPDLCVTPPKDSTEYQEFHANARITTAEGVLVPVGVLTMDVHHADTRSTIDQAKGHYDHSGMVAAYVRAGDDDYGVWVAGAIDPGLSKVSREKLARLSLSGDWRPVGGRYVLIAAQAVPVPGFPIRARVAAGEVTELQTLGPAHPEPEKPELVLVASALSQIAAKVGELTAMVSPLYGEWNDRRAIERAEAALALID